MKSKDVRNYEIRQTNWVKANNLTIDDKVIIMRTHNSYSKGWNMPWILEIEKHMNKPLTISAVHPKMGIEVIIRERLRSSITYAFLFVPYTVLQKVGDYYWCKPKSNSFQWSWERHPIEMFWKKNPNYTYSFVNPNE